MEQPITITTEQLRRKIEILQPFAKGHESINHFVQGEVNALMNILHNPDYFNGQPKENEQ